MGLEARAPAQARQGAPSRQARSALNDQRTLFDEPEESDEERLARERAERVREAERARDEAVRRVSRNADPEWTERARAMLRDVARRHQEFQSDLLWELGLDKPHEAKALGPVISWGLREGIIVRTDKLGRSTLVSSHRMPKNVWRSTIYEPA